MRQGQYVKAEFAAHLGEVHKGKASPEYGNPKEFFGRTFVTDGMRQLLVGVVQRLRGEGGDPVIDLKTAFGGGKTHSMLAVYHMVKSAAAVSENPDVQRIFAEAGGPPPAAKVAVIVGTDIDPVNPKIPVAETGGVEIRTLWGSIAWQLAGLPGYKIVAQHDADGIAPGADVLQEVFAAAGPSVILIDEFVAFLRNLPSTTRKDIPSGTFNTHMTFCQSLSEAVTKTPGTALLVSVPESAIEYGDARGQDIANRISNVFQRVGAPWQPVGSREAFEVVRRRLFGPIDDPEARDRACEAFFKLYREGNDFPAECREAAYLEQMKASYPIHPEIFERLYEDWAGNIDGFQRTRGVLRLLADVIYRLWVAKDSDPMILPGSLPMYDASVRQQLVGYLPGDNWSIPFDSDIDGEHSAAAEIERSNARFGQVQACLRLTRTILLGSVPGRAHQGLEVARIMLGAAQPGEGVSVYGDALRTIAGKLGYLWGTEQRYWFEVRANINRVAADRISRVTDDEAYDALRDRLKAMKDKGDFAGVHAAPKGPSDVLDEPWRDWSFSSQRPPTRRISPTARRGSPPGLCWTVVARRPASTRTCSRSLLPTRTPWRRPSKRRGDISAGRASLRTGRVARSRSTAASRSRRRSSATRPQRRSPIAWATRTSGCWCRNSKARNQSPGACSHSAGVGSGRLGSLADRASHKLIADGLLIKNWSPLLLKKELDEWIWKDGRPHVGLRQVRDYLATYPYFSRLRDESVLIEVVRNGVRTTEYFGYADGFEDDRYVGLVFGEQPRGITIDEVSVLGSFRRCDDPGQCGCREIGGRRWDSRRHRRQER